MNDVAQIRTLVRQSQSIAFTGERRDFFRLVRRGALLELITAGFYRFWLATDIRRSLWSGTLVDGHAPEYTGTAKELLIGFLFALAILVPVYLLYFLIGIEAERAKAFASIPLVLFFYAFAQFAIFRARRYRATRTVWRGARFWMSGSGWAYSWRACLWDLVVLLTLGLALPWRESALERYKMRHLNYGDLPGALRRHWLGAVQTWLVALASVLADRHAAVHLSRLQGCALAVVGMRHSLRRGALESDLRTGGLMGLYWAVIGWTTLLLIADVIVIAVVILVAMFFGGKLGGANAMLLFLRQHPYLALGANIANYLALVLCIGVIRRVYLTHATILILPTT